MIHQHLSDAANRWLDWLAILFAGVSAVSLIQGVAVVVTIVAGIVSIVIGGFRINDRIRNGRGQ
jgi:uncharacterized protein involved in cysteine biosynthesis